MEFFDVLKVRHSIRAYESRPIEPEKLQQLLQSINCAPSAGNLQAHEVYHVWLAGSQPRGSFQHRNHRCGSL
jgi:nitroreductase